MDKDDMDNNQDIYVYGVQIDGGDLYDNID